MADDEKKSASSPWELIGVLALLIGGLFALWVHNGGLEREGSLRGVFISPLEPVGSGEVYGPTLGEPDNSTPNQ